jgi:Cu2+-containing amine oxidase
LLRFDSNSNPNSIPNPIPHCNLKSNPNSNPNSIGLIHYFNANLVRDSGEAFEIKNAICMHEEDAGMGWKHTDWRTGEVRVSVRVRIRVIDLQLEFT